MRFHPNPLLYVPHVRLSAQKIEVNITAGTGWSILAGL